ncbi:hypothetical protein MMC07_002102 [Pseudocyphellaria aurata]|nr:hypothetical protein [Pseudocyphellaria aurata]
MPYNNAAIPPSEEITGSASLPLARVKRILHLDEEIGQCSANAAFAITVATEMFIRYLAEQALNVVKSERKPRRNIQYKDLANAVARIDNLEFLSDVIPRTTTFKEYKEKKARAARTDEPLLNGQTTLDGRRSLPQRPVERPGASENAIEDGSLSDATVDDHDANDSHRESSINGATVLQHPKPNGRAQHYEPEDVEMI